jgi:hypothetical protein
MFVSMANHPAVRSMISVSEKQSEEANRTTAALFMRLLTTSCREDAQRAIQFEGALALQAAFQSLGTVAGYEMSANPEVSEKLKGFDRYLDRERLQALVNSPVNAGKRGP